MEYQNENFNGEYDFRSRFHNGWQMHANLHEYSELIYCKKGSGYVTVDGKTICLNVGEMVWIPPNYIHQYDFKDSAQVICAVFSNDFIPLFFKKLKNRYLCASAINIAQLSEVIERFPNLEKEEALLISGHLNLIGDIVIKQSKFENERVFDAILCQKVISYLSENYTENITLAGLAKSLGYNEKYLSHVLHNLVGIHFRHLLNFYRVDHSKKLLTERKEMNVSLIATKSGFNSLNTFNREFKRIVGMTPSEYRKGVSPSAYGALFTKSSRSK